MILRIRLYVYIFVVLMVSLAVSGMPTSGSGHHPRSASVCKCYARYTIYTTLDTFIDFDLAWKFIDEKTKTHKPPGTRRFIDSICYASMKSHMCQELSRRDDLESWLYLSLELFDRQHLAWHDVTIAETVLNKKKNFAKNPDPKIFQKLALQYRLIMEHIMALSFDDAPEYPRLFALIAEAAKSLNVDFTSPYDWEP